MDGVIGDAADDFASETLREPVEARRTDALCEMAESDLNDPDKAATTGSSTATRVPLDDMPVTG